LILALLISVMKIDIMNNVLVSSAGDAVIKSKRPCGPRSKGGLGS
jgi:hypothetical protein